MHLTVTECKGTAQSKWILTTMTLTFRILQWARLLIRTFRERRLTEVTVWKKVEAPCKRTRQWLTLKIQKDSIQNRTMKYLIGTFRVPTKMSRTMTHHRWESKESSVRKTTRMHQAMTSSRSHKMKPLSIPSWTKLPPMLSSNLLS